jgi:hypothetical protein
MKQQTKASNAVKLSIADFKKMSDAKSNLLDIARITGGESDTKTPPPRPPLIIIVR